MKEPEQVISPFNINQRRFFYRKLLSWSVSEEFLDTDRLRKLRYGNLVLRRKSHFFLTHGVLVALLLFALFWLVTANWEIIASGREFSGKATPGESYESVTTIISLSPPPPSSSEPVAVLSEIHQPAVPSTVGKIVEVNPQEAFLEHTAATQQELKEATRSLGAGSGKGGESSGVDGLGEDGTTLGSLEKMPGFLEQKKPDYPEEARIAGMTGKVFVKVLIGEDGRPVKVTVMKRIPAECTVFDGAALKSVFESKYYPGMQNGRTVKVWCVVPVRFQLH